MFSKKTGDLEQELLQTHPSELPSYVRANRDELLPEHHAFARYMKERLQARHLQKQEVLLRADISLRYGYKLLSEEKVTRQRDVLLRICYAAEFTLEETQQALRLYRMDTLYARDPRDALLIACFHNRPGSILEVNELLLRSRLTPLRPSGVQE